ncbi:MAG: NAD(P)/FAD-dependent oxidoreductase, partial [Nitrospinota bacterium]
RRSARRVCGERFVLAGDSAGLARDFSGAGIGPAVRSACVAADAILAWLEGRGSLEAYGAWVAKTYGSGEEGLAGRLVGLMPDKAVRTVARAICGNAWLRRRLVLEGAFGIG